MDVRMKNFLGGSPKNFIFNGRVHRKPISRGDCLKKEAWQERGGGAFEGRCVG